MQGGQSAAARTVAVLLLIGSLLGLWRVLLDDAELRLSGEALTNFARFHPPKPWHGFQTAVASVAIDGEVHIKAHVSGYLIHTPLEISGTPYYDADKRAMFFRVSKAELPQDAARPKLSKINAMLSPLGTYIAQNLTDVFPVKKIKAETNGGAVFLATVKSVRVDGDAVVVTVHGYHVAAIQIVLAFGVLFSAYWLIVGLLRQR